MCKCLQLKASYYLDPNIDHFDVSKCPIYGCVLHVEASRIMAKPTHTAEAQGNSENITVYLFSYTCHYL